MRASRPILALLLAGVLATGCKNARPVAKDTNEDPRASLFPHEKHGMVECADCHGEVAKASRLGAAVMPPVDKCEECHPDLKKPSDDATRNAAAAAAAMGSREPREYQISFDHEGHLGMIGTDAKDPSASCKTCHTDDTLPNPGAARRHAPAMQTCTACHHHEQEVAEAKCSPCHVSLRRYPLQPIRALAGLSHTGEFTRRTHGLLAKDSAASCAQCHDQTYCATCHANATVPFRPSIQFPEKVANDFIHRGDFVSRHQIEAAADPAGCRRCHGSYFCDSCHKEQRVSHRNAISGNAGVRNPHPPGWASRGSPEFHGAAARQNIVTCAGCHDQQGAANLCVTCHRSLGPGISGSAGKSPHPPGFANKHGRDEIRKNGMCVACHTNG